MITRDIFESVCPSAVMPDETLFNRIQDYIAAAEEVVARIMGDQWPNYEGNAALALPAHRVICLHAYLEALPHLDIVLTETGLGVVSNQNVAPASSDRVNRLRKQIQDSRDDATDDLIDALRGVLEWRQDSIAADRLFSTLVWNARLQLPIMGITEAHRTKLTELRPKINEAEELLQHHVSKDFYIELCSAQLENDASAEQNTAINKSLFFIGAYLAGDRAMARFHMAKLVEYLEQHLTDFPTYEASTAHQANTFTPYENKKNDTTYFFG